MRFASGRTTLRVWRARTSRARLLGLLCLPPLGRGEALLLVRCASVHAVGMRYPLAVAFMHRTGRVMRVVDPLPVRGARCAGAWAVLEMASGGLVGVRAGDTLHTPDERVFPLAPHSPA